MRHADADVSVYISPDHHRQGIGRALYTRLFALLREQGLYVVCAGISLPNPGSVGLHTSLGFEPVGVYRDIGFKHGAWHSVGWWQRELRPRPDGPPPEPGPPREPGPPAEPWPPAHLPLDGTTT